MTPALEHDAHTHTPVLPLLRLTHQRLVASRQSLTDKSVNCEKEVGALKEKLTNVVAASEKVEADFNDFVKSHMVETPS